MTRNERLNLIPTTSLFEKYDMSPKLSSRKKSESDDSIHYSPNQMIPRLSSFELRLILCIEFVAILVGIILSRISINDLIWPPESYFYPRINLLEQDQLFELLAHFQWAAESANVTYFLSSGSMIGAIRHHGIIPWDDDIDVYVAMEDKEKLRRALKTFEPRYKLNDDSKISLLDKRMVWKFFDPNHGRSFIHHTFTWPGLDVFFVSTNGTHVQDQIGELDVPKSQVFPLKRRPFGKSLSTNPIKRNLSESLWLPVICKHDNPSYLQICLSPSYSHTVEFPIFTWSQRSINCSRLYSQYPFVIRSHVEYNLLHEEDLRIGQYVLYRLKLDHQECDGSTAYHSEPFKLMHKSSKLNVDYPVYEQTGFKINPRKPT